MRLRPGAIAVALGPILLVSSGCSMAAGGSRAPAASADPTTPGAAVDLSVYGAASLEDALASVETSYEAAVPGITLTIATDSSATLRTQIEQGAPADLLLSADQRNPEALVAAGLAEGAAVVFATTALAIIVPRDNPAGILRPADLANPGVTIVAAGEAVPISGYARRLVDRLARIDGYPSGFAAGYAANVVSKEANVSAVVAKIELGEADAAIVYATDARSSTRVKSIEIPPTANVVASYAGVVVRRSPHVSQAQAFLDWLAGPEGAAILATFGFGPPP